jgi:cobalt/nickel transport system ATP-binding protein
LSHSPSHPPLIPPLTGTHPPEKVGVAVRDIVFRYSSQNPILRGISFDLAPGERIALLGPTGSGKSTLMENLIGLKWPEEGQIWIGGTPLQPDTLPEVRRQVGFAFQDPDDQLFMPTLLDDVMFGPCNYGVSPAEAADRAEDLLAQFGLAQCARRSVHELSGGQKRLATLATILALNPSILILDEPTNGLDPWWRRHLAEILLELPVQVLLVASHDLNWIGRVTGRSLVLGDGQILADRPTGDLLEDRETLERCGLPPDC